MPLVSGKQLRCVSRRPCLCVFLRRSRRFRRLADCAHHRCPQLAEAFRDRVPDALYSSDLLRTRQTAEVFAEVTGLRVSGSS